VLEEQTISDRGPGVVCNMRSSHISKAIYALQGGCGPELYPNLDHHSNNVYSVSLPITIKDCIYESKVGHSRYHSIHSKYRYASFTITTSDFVTDLMRQGNGRL
jgi:hypothetical protein